MEAKIQEDAKISKEAAEKERAEAERLRAELEAQEKLLREQQAEVKEKQEEEGKEKQEEEAKRKEIEMKKQMQLEKEKEEAEKRYLEQTKQKEEQEQANEKQSEQEMQKEEGEMKTEVQLAPVPDIQELTPHLENVGNVQQRLFLDKQMEEDKKSSMDEKFQSETAGDAPTESIKVELNNSIRMRRLSRSITIDTDTDLEEHGEIEPYKSPKASNDIGSTNQIAVVDSVRTTRGGETDRELESGDTFDENSMMPMRSWNQSNINPSLLPGNETSTENGSLLQRLRAKIYIGTIGNLGKVNGKNRRS